MVNLIGTRPLNSNISLRRLKNALYIPKCLCNPLAYLKEGCCIWKKARKNYIVYELTESWDSEKESDSDFVSRLEESISQNR